ncbi:MAG: substrate-binding domain-containing protein [Candidatus Korarchaeum sp.]
MGGDVVDINGEDALDELDIEPEIMIKRGNSVLLDKRAVDILRAIEMTGSLTSSAKLLGLPYSKVWRQIAFLESKLGARVIEPRRGGKLGGGTELTRVGTRLLKLYEDSERKLGLERKLELSGTELRGELTVMGSHDLLLEVAVERLRRKGRRVEAHWIGSYGGLLSLSLGDADVAGIHLLDTEINQYNIPVVRRMFPSGVAVIRGYEREVGWVYKNHFSPGDLMSGNLRLANRNKGSGTRVLIDRILRELSGNGAKVSDLVRGYRREYFTHSAVCKAIADGRADVSISIRPVAEKYGLKFLGICWEHYDFAVLEESLEKEILSLLLGEISKISPPDGYKLPEDMGSRIF